MIKLIGFLLAGLSYPAMFYLADKRALPRWPPDEVLYACDAELRGITHCLKDQVVAIVRFDAQYWTKAFVFVILALLILNGWQCARCRAR